MTDEEKRELYIAGHFVCEVPPVSTAFWTAADWIKWIDRNGRWTPPAEPVVECPVCGGQGELLSTLGNLSHYRCRNCGLQLSQQRKR